MSQPATPGPLALLDLITGSMVTQAIHVAAKLGVADLLAAGPLTAAEIARRSDADADATYRVLRLLASHEIFAEGPDGRFALTPLAQGLRADAPLSMRGLALLLGHPLAWEDWGNLLLAVTSGDPVLPQLRGMGGYEFLMANPEFAVVFESGMGSLSQLETEPILAAYDFSGFDTVVDVFGGQGGLLAGILKAAPGSRGILADQRAEHLGAAAFFGEAGLADRVSIDTAGLFEKIPSGGDAYLMKHILHEWPESQAVDILHNARRAIGDGGKLLLMEYVVPEGGQQHLGKLIDLWLMILMGGKERTTAQYAELLARTGFRLDRVVGTGSPVSIIEAVPV